MKAMLGIVVLSAVTQGLAASSEWTQERLEKNLKRICIMARSRDNYMYHSEPEYIPQRKRDAIASDLSKFITDGGWTTNQLINGLICAATNNLTDVRYQEKDSQIIAGTALGKLSKINHPLARQFIMEVCTNNVRDELVNCVEGIFRYTSFEPEVMSYMRKLCMMTNRYETIESLVSVRMVKCLSELPNNEQAVATTNVAKYLYFAFGHLKRGLYFHDMQLMKLCPAYSNSVQRLEAMQYGAEASSNSRERARLGEEVSRLEALPKESLADLPWLKEE